MFSFKNVEKALVLLWFRSNMQKQQLVLLCFHSKMLKTIGFTVFSLKHVKNNHWFYCVFAQKYKKSTGFTVFSIKKVEKPLVLL